jgi:hypothetical protein
MQIDGGRSLGAAIAMFSLELQRADPMVTVDALEDAAVLDTCVRVMSHSCYCSPLSRKFRGTLVTKWTFSFVHGTAFEVAGEL